VCTEPDLSRRNSNAIFSALLFREESRAMKTSMMVLSTYLFSWTPLFVHVSIVGLPDEVLYSCALSAATLNPLVYVFRNDAFRKEMLRLMCSRKTVAGVGHRDELRGRLAPAAPVRRVHTPTPLGQRVRAQFPHVVRRVPTLVRLGHAAARRFRRHVQPGKCIRTRNRSHVAKRNNIAV